MKKIQKVVTRNGLRALIEKSRGTLFTVEFVKKNGKLRKMTCRTGVHKNLRGGHSNVADKPNYIVVYDMHDYGYKTVNLDTTQSIKMGGFTYKVI